MAQRGSWPKSFAPLTGEQERIRDDFMRHWHEVLPRRYGAIERFNHGFPASTASPGVRTLEIGAGLGEHLRHETVEAGSYVAMELREEMGAAIRRQHPNVEVIVGDCQQRLPFPDASFDRVLAIHVLEHLTNLPPALDEVRRVLRPDGQFLVAIRAKVGLQHPVNFVKGRRQVGEMFEHVDREHRSKLASANGRSGNDQHSLDVRVLPAAASIRRCKL